MKQSRYWSTQPIKLLTEESDLKKGNITGSQVSLVKEPSSLPDGFFWGNVDVSDFHQLDTLFKFLLNNYSQGLRTYFSKKFIKWALGIPGSLAVGIYDQKDLIGFISGIPATCLIEGEELRVGEISFLCVSQTHRELGFTPILSAEITRRLNMNDIFHGVFMAENIVCGRIAECEYFHKQLNSKKLFDLGIVKSVSDLKTSHGNVLVELTQDDLADCRDFVNSFLKNNFLITKKYTSEEFEWLFLPRSGIVSSWITMESDKVTGFCSVLLNDLVGKDVTVSHLVYCLSKNQEKLLSDALPYIKKESDILTCVGFSGLRRFLPSLGFSAFSKTNYYLYNWNYPFVSNIDTIAYPLF